MTTSEFSNEFDILYNNIMSNAAPGLNEYEKSVFLTKAQEEIIKNYFNPKGNKYSEGFDGSAKRQIDFSGLITVANGTVVDSSSTTFDVRAKVYKLPVDLFLMINESLTTNTGVKQVIPIRYDEYTRLMSKPYKEPLKYQAWRLVTKGEGNTVQSEVIPHSGETISKYTVRYIRRPAPIILTNLSSEYGDVSINGKNTVSECELNPLIHGEILQRGVELAKATYEGDLKASVELGNRSE